MNEQGRVETEVTISRLDEATFYVISGPMGHVRDLDWFRQHTARPEGGDFDVTITDRTTEFGTLAIAGPNARALLAAVTDADVSNEAFGFLTAQRLVIADVDLRALRVGFSGSRGWELHIPMAQMLDVYRALWAASDANDFGLADVGSHALDSLRMEKAYLTRFELTHDIGPYQAGVERWVRPQKGEFIGRAALES